MGWANVWEKCFFLHHFIFENDLILKNLNDLKYVSYQQTLSVNLLCHHSNAISKHIIHKKC